MSKSDNHLGFPIEQKQTFILAAFIYCDQSIDAIISDKTIIDISAILNFLSNQYVEIKLGLILSCSVGSDWNDFEKE